MWIGRAATTSGQRLLINFGLPFSTRSTLHRSRKDMFLVIPAESLRLDLHRVDAGSLPEATLSQLRDAGPAALREGLVRARFSLGNPAYVVMPKLRRPLATPLTGVPSRLILSMRSLSGVREFDVYLSRGTVELELQVIRSILRQNDVGTPELDFHATFSGGLGGGKNLWQSYPCEEKGNLSWNPLIDNDPPPYGNMAAHADACTDPCAILKETRSRLCKKPAPENLSSGRLSRVRPSPDSELLRTADTETKRPLGMQGHKRKVSEAISDYEKQHLGKRDAGGSTQETGKGGPAAAQTITVTHRSPASAQASRYASGPVLCGDTTKSNGATVSDAERHKALAVARHATAADTTAPDPPAHRTMYRSPAPNPLAPARLPLPAPPADEEVATPAHLRAAIMDCLHARAAQSLTDPSPLHTPHPFLELTEFLAAASRIDPHAHETHSALLLALGAAAREGDIPSFDANMRLCQQRVLRDAWAQRTRGRDDVRGAAAAAAAAEELLGECFALLDWLNGSVCRIAGTMMMGMLVGLVASLPAQAPVIAGMGGAVEKSRREWTENLAKVRATAFWAFGDFGFLYRYGCYNYSVYSYYSACYYSTGYRYDFS
ncbi:hypothetical protein B0J12DRAFT_790165 [Macrophomina phaseolina]|uniref:Uncharacterized protein n=1 Tax=Macrophomina phaseolina TaxID=35725 RepID=A0ABQ8FTN8_9PEZI|nr:hypothetical protein B0J12DRAFT_790165 [Macrophomina phaseolina]